jgi:hypothetical protein
MGRRGWTWDLWVAAGGLLVATAGAVLLAGSLRQQAASFGWFAYAPLSATTFSPSFGTPGAGGLFGYGLAVVGLLVIAWTVGYRFSPRADPALLTRVPARVRMLAAGLSSVAVLLGLGGAALLVASPPSMSLVLPELAPSSEVSTAYGSSLAIAYDEGHGPLLVPGVALVLGGLLTSATALGWRSGHGPEVVA